MPSAAPRQGPGASEAAYRTPRGKRPTGTEITPRYDDGQKKTPLIEIGVFIILLFFF